MKVVYLQGVYTMDLKLTGYNWFSDGCVSARGYCFDSYGNLYAGNKLLEYFASASDETSLHDLLTDANGIFAFVINKPDFKAIAIDGSRIYPLFYRLGDEVSVADNPYDLIDGSSALDKQAVDEYLCSGAVFAGKTLVSEILQVKPSHYVVFDGVSAHETEYWNYCTKAGEEMDCSLEQLDCVFEKVFRRMLESAKGRQIVVPLSGGYDSRLIVCWQKRLGVENVVCYTVGRPKSQECHIAEIVAKRLGYRHYFIDNTSTEFVPSYFYNDADFQKYCHFVGALGNFLWVFEYFAVKWLKDNAIIDDNAVFVPGHSADFIAGSHLRKALVTQDSSVGYLTSAIMNDSFEYGCMSSYVHSKVKSYFLANERIGVSAHTNYMSFIMQNRLAHQINNSARLYEFFGYDVRLPFWDKELLNLFKALPYKRLENCNLYVEYVSKCVFSKFGVDFGRNVPDRKAILRQRLKNRLKPFLPKSFVRKFVMFHDDICERELTAPMVTELIDAGVYADDRHFLSYNEVMRDWYLEMVKRKLVASWRAATVLLGG